MIFVFYTMRDAAGAVKEVKQLIETSGVGKIIIGQEI